MREAESKEHNSLLQDQEFLKKFWTETFLNQNQNKTLESTLRQEPDENVPITC